MVTGVSCYSRGSVQVAKSGTYFSPLFCACFYFFIDAHHQMKKQQYDNWPALSPCMWDSEYMMRMYARDSEYMMRMYARDSEYMMRMYARAREYALQFSNIIHLLCSDHSLSNWSACGRENRFLFGALSWLSFFFLFEYFYIQLHTCYFWILFFSLFLWILYLFLLTTSTITFIHLSSISNYVFLLCMKAY